MVAQNSVDQAFPDTLWLGLTSYGVLAGLVDGAGRPLFPYLGAATRWGPRMPRGMWARSWV